MMRIVGLDPGSEHSAIVVLDVAGPRDAAPAIVQHATWPNDILIMWLTSPIHEASSQDEILVVEQIESYGMAVGAEVFRTVWWAGRFHQAWAGVAEQLPRRAVKLHLCQSARATDANVRQAILDRYGATKLAAIGRKAAPGPLYGVKGHEYAALAVALTWADTHRRVRQTDGEVYERREVTR